MSELQWGNEKAKGETNPFETDTTAGAVFLENTTLTPISGQSDQNIGTIADETIRINPVGQQDPEQPVSIIDGIDDWNPENINTKAMNAFYLKKETEKRTGARKKSLPLFEPDLPAEDDNNNSFLAYQDQLNSNNEPEQQLQEHEKDLFETIQGPTIPSTFTPQNPIVQSSEGEKNDQNSGRPLYPPTTPYMEIVNVNEQTLENKEIRNNNVLLTLIKNTFKRLTHKKKLIDRMEEWQPLEMEESAEEFIPSTTKSGIPIIPERNITAEHKNIKNATVETATLEEIRKVIPIDPENVDSESKQKSAEVQDENIPSEVPTKTVGSGQTDITAASAPDTSSSYSPEEIQKIKEELADSKKGNEDLGKDIRELTGNISNLESSMDSMKRDGENFNSIANIRIEESAKKIEFLEERLTEFEVTLENIHTDNAELRTGLNTIEQNITEIAGSYSIILKQIQKLTEFGNSRSAEIFEANQRIDKLDQTLLAINNIQEESQKSILELRSVTADLIRSVEKTHNDNRKLRAESEQQDQLIKDELLSLTDFVEKEFKNLGGRSYRANGENIQLNNLIKNSTNMKLCMEWLEFLMELVGRNHLEDILSYYEELGWISEDVKLELMLYAEGIDYYIEKADWKLAPDDHVKSIWFIEQLAGLKVDKNRLSIVEKNIKKVKNGTEIYGI
ncbi:FlaD/FlaE family flagellar protein [Methanococcoides sp. FTZ1]|uniref:FlaD/FlaE family flagellar protein n=1 Tax=Methanococcoides sp. FTZ1 TaxID=3439061 RepID=UPI003F83329C